MMTLLDNHAGQGLVSGSAFDTEPGIHGVYGVYWPT